MSVKDAGLYGDEQSAGHSGAATSERAAKRVTGHRSIQVFQIVDDRGEYGITCRELQKRLTIEHGAASGALTRLHRGGFITRLTEERGDQQVYVLPQCTLGREEAPYRPNVAYREGYKTPMALDPITVHAKPEWTDGQILEAMGEAGIHEANLGRIKELLEVLPDA